MRLLAHANIHAGTVFPNYDGVRRAIQAIGYHATSYKMP